MNMGASSNKAKGSSEAQSVLIDHPQFRNAKLVGGPRDQGLEIVLSVQEAEFTSWRSQTAAFKLSDDYLLNARSSEFKSKGVCGNSGLLKLTFDNYPYLLKEEIEKRGTQAARFEESDLWYLLLCLCAAQEEMRRACGRKLGYVQPESIFISEEGEIKVVHCYSFPRGQHEEPPALPAPEELGVPHDFTNTQAELFSIGMTVLGAGLLKDPTTLYDTKMQIKTAPFQQAKAEWLHNTLYSPIFTALISNLISIDPSRRISSEDLWGLLVQHQNSIQDKEPFVIVEAPNKLHEEVLLMRPQSLPQRGSGLAVKVSEPFKPLDNFPRSPSAKISFSYSDSQFPHKEFSSRTSTGSPEGR